jgi:hypothetical protein
MSRHLRNKGFKSEGAIVVDKDGTIKFENHLLDYLSRSEKFPQPSNVAFSKHNIPYRRSIKQEFELKYLEKLVHNKKEELNLKEPLKNSYYEKYKKQSDKILKLLRKN